MHALDLRESLLSLWFLKQGKHFEVWTKYPEFLIIRRFLKHDFHRRGIIQKLSGIKIIEIPLIQNCIGPELTRYRGEIQQCDRGVNDVSVPSFNNSHLLMTVRHKEPMFNTKVCQVLGEFFNSNTLSVWIFLIDSLTTLKFSQFSMWSHYDLWFVGKKIYPIVVTVSIYKINKISISINRAHRGRPPNISINQLQRIVVYNVGGFVWESMCLTHMTRITINYLVTTRVYYSSSDQT